MLINEAFAKFRVEMMAKMKTNEFKHGPRSLWHESVREIYPKPWSLMGKMQEEIGEFLGEDAGTPGQSAEAVDVANMMFLQWWWNQEQSHDQA